MSLPYRDHAKKERLALTENTWYLLARSIAVPEVSIENGGKETGLGRIVSRAKFLRCARGLYVFYIEPGQLTGPDKPPAKDYPFLFLVDCFDVVKDSDQNGP